ncbi:hypothetical protein [Antarcticimicrobium sediminis]|uniref:hypothetical protein n=1 Tax=Antarcticimicrobium sediminis TaxID=2546227 RepID=UPI00140449EB|nr:hypothetical protein [Antarcticimicrobium sediminis]
MSVKVSPELTLRRSFLMLRRGPSNPAFAAAAQNTRYERRLAHGHPQARRSLTEIRL